MVELYREFHNYVIIPIGGVRKNIATKHVICSTPYNSEYLNKPFLAEILV